MTYKKVLCEYESPEDMLEHLKKTSFLECSNLLLIVNESRDSFIVVGGSKKGEAIDTHSETEASLILGALS